MAALAEPHRLPPAQAASPSVVTPLPQVRASVVARAGSGDALCLSGTSYCHASVCI